MLAGWLPGRIAGPVVVVAGPVVVAAELVVVDAALVVGPVEGAVPVVVVRPLTALRSGPGVVDGGGAVVGSRVAVMVVDVEVGAGVSGRPAVRRRGLGVAVRARAAG
jgi:hypothetical protein